MKMVQELHAFILHAERAAGRLEEIRKYIAFEGSPDIIEVLNEFAEQDTEDSP